MLAERARGIFLRVVLHLKASLWGRHLLRNFPFPYAPVMTKVVHCNSTEDFVKAFREQVRVVLTGRLIYYLGHMPTEAEMRSLSVTADGNFETYTYRNEVILVLDFADQRQVKFSAWDRITEAEVDGSSPGPGWVQRQCPEIWDDYTGETSFTIMNLREATPEPLAQTESKQPVKPKK